jgi:predicted DNA-binding protein YlxM (UPF0122 family)
MFSPSRSTLDDKVQLDRLFRQYAPLLTGKQRLVLDRYLEGDLSLAEIGDELKISRQGVYDLVRRASNTLKRWESRIGFCRRLEEVGRCLSPVFGEGSPLSPEERATVEEFFGV